MTKIDAVSTKADFREVIDMTQADLDKGELMWQEITLQGRINLGAYRMAVAAIREQELKRATEEGQGAA